MRGYGSGDGEVVCKNEEIQDGCVKQKRKEKRKTKFHRQCVCTTRVQPLLRSFIYVGLCEYYIYIYIRARTFLIMYQHSFSSPSKIHTSQPCVTEIIIILKIIQRLFLMFKKIIENLNYFEIYKSSIRALNSHFYILFNAI